MFPIAFDISDVVKEFHFNKSEMDSLSNYILDRVVGEFMDNWKDIINTQLNSSRDEYKRGMYTDRPNSNTAIIGLTGRDSKLAMMIEMGATAFDEKEGFEKSTKKTMKADGGWYLTIPFRHGTSEAIMSMGAEGQDMSILEYMKAGNTVTSQELPMPFDEIKTHALQLKTGTLITYKHKAPIHEGMHRRDISSTEKEKRGGYFTFRRVSDKTDEQAWIHPGFEAHNFMEQALEMSKLDLVVDDAVQEFLDAKYEE